MEVWDLWYPDAAATGLSFARGRLDPTDTLLVHAAPPELDVSVREIGGALLARGKELKATQKTPIARLRRIGNEVTREDIWPSAADSGSLVILPGGEVGTLKAWWNADDHSAWRWQVEFYNHR